MNISHDLLWSMALFAFVTSITPGPNNLMLLASGLNYGVKKTFPHIAGIACGFTLMLIVVGFGVGELIYAVPSIYMVIKVLGFIYMLYLAWAIATSQSTISANIVTSDSKPMSFIGAAAFQWVNPKAWAMAVGFFSNYIPSDAGYLTIIFSSFIFGIVNFPSVAVWAIMGFRMRKLFEVDVYRKIFNVTMALLLIVSMIPSLLT